MAVDAVGTFGARAGSGDAPSMSFLDKIAQSAPIAAGLAQLAQGEQVVFEHVVPAARAVLCALIANRMHGRRIWIVCADVRTHEGVYNEVLNWNSDALLFPEVDVAWTEGAIPNPETAAERLAILDGLRSAKSDLVLLVTRASLEDAVPSPKALKQFEVQLTRGKTHDREVLIAQLDASGYEQEPQVSLRGQYAVRGGILDVFSFHHTLPVRLEFFGDEIESIRLFDLDSQDSIERQEKCTLLLEDVGAVERSPGASRHADIKLSEYIGKDDLVIDLDTGFEGAHVCVIEGSAGTTREEDFGAAFFDHGLGEFDAGDFVIDEIKRERFFSQLREWREGKWSVHIVCNNEGEIERLHDLVPPVESDSLQFHVGALAKGFTFPASRIAVLSDAELFGRYRNTRGRRIALKRAREIGSRSPIDYADLAEGELVVHLEHGIGRFEGMKNVPKADGRVEEVLAIAFANDARLYVPLEQSFVISRYVGIGRRNPPLSELGDSKWSRAKNAAEKAVFDYAGRLLHLHAERETLKGFAFPPDKKWQREFESSFLYKETPDQLTAIAATKADMESEQPMDRLICGDVGFGKTEVAIRAAFKAVMGGKQVAMLVPTTVLAEQHYRTFRERMSDYPIAVDMLSRFRTQREQKNTLKLVAEGSVDIVIGTHRLISKDVHFKDLGLVIIDEEQRFGVLHKEKFKDLFRLVDMLTLSATPIPRTLYLSLMGAKDMSTIETAPPNRLPVETVICPYDERIIRDAVKREIARQGQVYFLHNRIATIERVCERVQKLVPEARIAVGHGRMEEDELEAVMQRFVNGEADVLISTTIIESGLDIPNANTIVIDRADRFGLADLYQLRGRVGRAQQKAYAYLMLPRDMMSAGEARKRINAIKQYSSLGAGFKIAMRDLEIRGAGNILGTAQSGHVINVGFELYCSLLRQAVGKLKGEEVSRRVDIAMHLDFVCSREAEYLARNAAELAPAFLPASYIGDSQVRMQTYRRLSEAAKLAQIEKLRHSWTDRFGQPPEAVVNLLHLNEIKIAAVERKIAALEVKDGKVMLTRGGGYITIGGKFPRLQDASPSARLSRLLSLIQSL